MAQKLRLVISIAFLWKVIDGFNGHSRNLLSNFTVGTSTIATANSGMAVCYYQNKTYLFGGKGESQYNRMYSFNVDSDASVLTNWLLSGHIIGGGGNIDGNGQFWTPNNDMIYMIDHAGIYISTFNFTATQFAANSITIPIRVHEYGCLSHVDHYLIISGGSSSGSYDIQIYDISLGDWLDGSVMPTLLHKRGSHACVVHPRNKMLYVIGGYTGDFLNSIETLHVGDIANIQQYSFTQVSDTLMNGKSGLRSVIVSDFIYVMGGTYFNYVNSTFTPYYPLEIEVIDTNTDAITVYVDQLSFGVSTPGVVVLDDIIHVFGGYHLGHVDVWQYNMVNVSASDITTDYHTVITTETITTDVTDITLTMYTTVSTSGDGSVSSTITSTENTFTSADRDMEDAMTLPKRVMVVVSVVYWVLFAY